MATTHIIELNIAKRLSEDSTFRKNYFRAESRNEIAAQLIRVRKLRRMRQADLAKAVDTQQSAISRLEKADYASWNNQTLEAIAEALDARWKHVLEPMEDAIKQYEHNEQELACDRQETSNLTRLIEDFENPLNSIVGMAEAPTAEMPIEKAIEVNYV